MVYEFKCPECGHVFNQDFAFNDIVDATRCPKCHTLALRRFSVLNHIWKEGQKPN